MTQFEQKPNTFVLFVNDKKADNQPDFTGKIKTENGKELKLACWKKTSKQGVTYLSGVVNEFDDKSVKSDGLPF